MKEGRTLSLFVPDKDGAMILAGKIQLDLVTPFYVGLGVCAHNDAQLETAVFSNVELTEPAAPAVKPAAEKIQEGIATLRCAPPFPSVAPLR